MDAPFPSGMLDEWTSFFRDVHPQLKPGADIYEEIFSSQFLFPLQRQRELVKMLRIARAIEPKTVMEIGADKAGSLYHWCMLPSVENVIACEIRGTPYDLTFEQAFPNLDFHWMPCSSYDGPGRRSVDCYLISRRNPPIDVLFIDGDKLAFKKDYDLYRPLVRPGGIIFVHDIRDNPQPRQDWEAICRENGGNASTIIDIEDSNEAIVRENAGIAPASPHEAWLRHWRGRSCGVGVIRIPATDGKDFEGPDQRIAEREAR